MSGIYTLRILFQSLVMNEELFPYYTQTEDPHNDEKLKFTFLGRFENYYHAMNWTTTLIASGSLITTTLMLCGVLLYDILGTVITIIFI